MGKILHRFDDHEDSVVTLDWSHFKPNIFASGSIDNKVKIWDLMRVGFEIPKDLGGTDELLVMDMLYSLVYTLRTSGSS